jgi:RHS repeat-associated protein
MSRSSATSYYEADGLGSVTSLSNGVGSFAQTYTFDSFGKQTGSSGSLTNPFQYTAREFDSETGLYYYRARYYDPATGRFLSEDPIGINSDDLDLYRYVHDSPTNLTDADGLGGKTYDCGGGCGFRIETDPWKGRHINWWCNGAKGCLLFPSFQPCEVGSSNVPPDRILRCIRKKLRMPDPNPAPQPCRRIQLPNPVPIADAILVSLILYYLWRFAPAY